MNEIIHLNINNFKCKDCYHIVQELWDKISGSNQRKILNLEKGHSNIRFSIIIPNKYDHT